jgi:hypothetical protein
MNPVDYLNYRVDDFVTTNKLAAAEKANNNFDNIHFYFADDAHSKFDWTVEPQEDINDLIDQRVREIRDQYAYVALWYSGGYDSQSILDSFVRQNIRLDEIVIYSRRWMEHEYNVEHIHAYNYANYVKKIHQPWMNINVLYYDHNSLFDFYKTYGHDWIYKDFGSRISFNKPNRSNTAHFQKEFRTFVNTIGRVDINGVDKPKVNLYNNKWYSQAPDKAFYDFFESPYELFYLSPAATKIYIKQTWLAIKWFEQLENISHELVHKIQGHQAGGDLYAKWNLCLGRSHVHDQIAKYGLFKMLLGFGERPFETRAMLDALQTQDTRLYQIWKSGVDFIKQSQPENWEPNTGLKTILSRPIFVKDFDSGAKIVK